MASRPGFVAVTLMALAGAVGCGQGASTSLSGSVTYNGAPVENGSVSFAPVGGGTSFGAEIVDGRYAAEKPTPGKFQVLIRADRPAQIVKTREEAERQLEANAGNPLVSANYIPEDAAGNGQQVEIKSGSQTLDFALTGPPRQ
jgi:hypothetical protein